MIKDGEVQARAFQGLRAYMAEELGHDERLCKALIPEFPVGCRRLTPGVGYLPALKSHKTRVVTQGIAKIVKKGIQLNSGEIIPLDAIVCATGFDVSFSPRFPIIGREGNLQDIWARQLPRAYMSCAIASLPNYFGE
jgi:cation diffusion facilitator CzcD-associated flavoprotein CzcO